MPKYRFKTPDGTFVITAPEGMSPEEAYRAFQGQQQKEYETPKTTLGKALKTGVEATADVGRGAAHGLARFAHGLPDWVYYNPSLGPLTGGGANVLDAAKSKSGRTIRQDVAEEAAKPDQGIAQQAGGWLGEAAPSAALFGDLGLGAQVARWMSNPVVAATVARMGLGSALYPLGLHGLVPYMALHHPLGVIARAFARSRAAPAVGQVAGEIAGRVGTGAAGAYETERANQAKDDEKEEQP